MAILLLLLLLILAFPKVSGPFALFLLVGVPVLLGVSSCISAYPQTSNYIGGGLMVVFFGCLMLSIPLLLWRERHTAFYIPPRHGPAPGGTTEPGSAAVPAAPTAGGNS